MRSKLTSRMLAVLLAVVMVAGLLPLSALAARVERDGAPVAETAVGEEVEKASVRPAKAAEVEETETETETETDEEQPVPVPDPEAPAGCKYYPLQTKMLTVKGHDKKNNVPGNMLDGLYWTQWVANWGFGGEGEESRGAEDNWIQITLPQAVKVQGLRYQARYDEPGRGYASGGFGQWKLETSEDGVIWTDTVTGHWGVEGTPENEEGEVQFEGTYYKPESSEWYYAGWDEPVETRYIRLTATQLYAYEEQNKNYGSCAEIRLVVTEEQEIPQEAEYEYDCELAKDGPVNGGVYAIFTNRNNIGRDEELTKNALLTYSGTGDVTGQVEAGAISDDDDRQYLDLNHDRTFFPVETQLWQAIETEDGWLLKSLAGNRNKYLELSLNDGSAHSHGKVNRAPQTLTVEAATKDNSYKILQQREDDGWCSLNWDSGSYYTHNADNGFALRFYEWKGGEVKTEAVEEPEEPGTEPENPGEEPENPGEEPENPGTEPEEPGDNTGDDTPTTPTTPSKPTSRPTVSPAEPEEDLDDPDVPLAERPMQFEDVTEDDWFFEGVKYNFNNNLMKGTSDSWFEPYLDTTRGMIVTILHRVEGEPEVELADFADVEDGMWYTAGVAWGKAADIALGVEDGTNFLPTVDVTREQMAAFLYRYAQYKGYDVTASGELDDFSDGGDTSDWAAESVRWAVGAGLIEGKGNHILDPKSTATRGEVALILMRFCENFMK